jgi:hypothetical protein
VRLDHLLSKEFHGHHLVTHSQLITGLASSAQRPVAGSDLSGGPAAEAGRPLFRFEGDNGSPSGFGSLRPPSAASGNERLRRPFRASASFVPTNRGAFGAGWSG